MLRILTGTLILACVATVAWWLVGEKNFEYAATRTALAYEMKDTCPLSYAAMKSENVGLISICSTFGLKAYLAARASPETAGELFATYGDLADFREVVEKHGEEALAVIQYFRERDSREFRVRARARQLWERFRSGEPLDVPPVKLSADDHGFIAIQELKRRGHSLLAEFEFTDGVKRKQVRRAILAATELFTSGITDLEARMIRGEKVTWKHVAYAALDVSVIVGGAAAVAHVLRGAKTVQRVGVLAKAGGAFRTAGAVVKTVAIVGTVSTLALVAYNPSLMISAAGWIAEQVGLPSWVGVAALMGIVAFGLMTLIELIYRVLYRLSWPYRFGMRAYARVKLHRARRKALRSRE